MVTRNKQNNLTLKKMGEYHHEQVINPNGDESEGGVPGAAAAGVVVAGGGHGGGAAHGEGATEGDGGGLGGAEQAAVALGTMIATQALGWAVDYGSARLKKKGYTKTSKVLWGVGCFLSVFVTLAKAYLMANRGGAIGDEAKGPAPAA